MFFLKDVTQGPVKGRQAMQTLTAKNMKWEFRTMAIIIVTCKTILTFGVE